jgi:hypothetical protein
MKAIGGRDQGRNGDERARANEVEWREKAERQRAQAPDQGVIFSDGACKHHPHDVGRQHGLAVRPGRQRSETEQEKEQIFRLELGGAIAVALEKSRRKPRKNDENENGDRGKDGSLDGEWREDETERKHRPEIVDEAGGKHDLAVIGFVETVFQHDGVNDCYGSR